MREELEKRTPEELEMRQAIEAQATQLGINTERFQQLLDRVENSKDLDPKSVAEVREGYEAVKKDIDSRFGEHILLKPLMAGSGAASVVAVSEMLSNSYLHPKHIAVAGGVVAGSTAVVIGALWGLARFQAKAQEIEETQKIRR